MIDRRTVNEDRVELTFRLPFDHPAGPVGVAGDFNGWEITPLVDGDGTLQLTVVVAAGRRYQFRYRTSDGRWFNDEGADDYEANEFGGMNCVVDLTAN